MIRVLHAVSSTSTTSGVMSVLMNYARLLRERGIVFDYLAFSPREWTYDDEIATMGGCVFYHPRPSRSKRYQSQTEAFFQSYCAQHRADTVILHCHPIYASAFYAREARHAGIVHVIQHSHTSRYSSQVLSAMRNRLVERLFGDRADVYAACSKEAAALLTHAGQDEVFLMRNAIDYRRFLFSIEQRSDVRTRLAIPEDALVIGHIGRFSPEKNHLFLLQLFKAVCELYEAETFLLLVGDGPLMDTVKSRAERMGMGGRILFAGAQRHTQDYLSAMDVFVMPSVFEGFGIALIEAQASGLCCLASDAIPQEIDITGRVHKLPLHIGADAWARELLRISGEEGADDRADVCPDTRYEIHDAVNALDEFYRKLEKT